MKTFFALFLFVCSTALVAQSITIHESEAQISFVFLDDGVEGTIEGFHFTGDINLNALESSSISGTAITKTLDTNNWLRSRHLRSKKFFNAKEFPTLNFNNTHIVGDSKFFQVTGTLILKGISKTVVWQFRNEGSKLIGTAKINTADFNITIHKEKERNEVDITILLPYSPE